MNMTEAKESRAKHWLSYRSELKVLDCTVRDGGLMNDHGFDDKTVKAVYKACVEAGIDYMEFGYKASKRIFAPSQFGPWKYCSEDDLRRIVGDNETDLKISVMADAERTDYHEDILPREQSVIDMIRVATYIHQIPTAMDMIKDAHDKGYETSINLMAVSSVQEWELDEALEIMADSEAGVIVLVDSWGSFYSEQIHYLMRKYLRHAIPRGKMVGMHAHNNQQLAFANTVEAIILGANLLDGSLAGLGRGAGNCPMELLLGFLHNPKYRLRPVLECIRDHIEPLHAKLRWGPDIPYMITGVLNQHPRSAMQFNAGEDRGNVVKFFDMMVEEE
jgi:4-hydroxy 2-oxovalerate aldolase